MVARWLIIVLITIVTPIRCRADRTMPAPTFPIYERCPNSELSNAPGIGFDLTHSYGIGAIQFQNGSVVFVPQIMGDVIYRQLMWNKSHEPSRPKEPRNLLDKQERLYKQMQRTNNKFLGHPSTQDVSNIASILIPLRRITEQLLGHEIKAVTVAIPSLPGITNEDLDDALEYAGLTALRDYDGPQHLTQASAADAALGRGFCHSPRNFKNCTDEETNMPYRDVISISYTEWVLSLTYSVCHSANQCRQYKSQTEMLGRIFSLNSKDPYWSQMRQIIQRFIEDVQQVIVVSSMGGGSNGIEIQVFGSQAGYGDFLDTIENALRRLDPKSGMVIFKDVEKQVPLSLVARGAAMFSKRIQERNLVC